MKRFDSKLKISASVFALLCGGVLASSPALAVTYDGEETGVEITTDITGDLIVSATGSISPDGLFVDADVSGNFSNAGLIEALASDSITETGDAEADAIAIDFNGTVAGAFTNTGVINAEATASAVFSTSGNGSYDNWASASASGVDVNGVTGNVTNSGTISALALASQKSSYGTADDPVSDITVDDGGTAYAIALEVDNTKGTISNSATLSAKADLSVDSDAVGTGDWVELDLGYGLWADATGFYESGGGTFKFANSGTITADTSSSLAVTANADASESWGSITLTDVYVSAYAYGAWLYGNTTDFNNSGTISAIASAQAVENVQLSAETWASIELSNVVSASATGVYVDNLTGAFANSGTISAAASAELSQTAHATSATSEAYVEPDDYVNASAIGVEIDNLTGSFANAANANITADAKAKAAYDLSAVGGWNSWIDVDSVTASSTATGVTVNGGEYSFTNDGAISAVATSDMSVVAVASAAETSAGISAYVSVSANAYGAVLDGAVKSFTNTGSISATASASSAITLTGKGVTDASVSLEHEFSVGAVGVKASDVAGNLTNSGTISASATGTVSTTIASSFGAEAGDVLVDTSIDVNAVGISADFAAPGEKEDPRAFTNSKIISATATLSVNTVVPASTDPEPTVDTVAGVEAIGAFLNGSLGTVNNSGTISAAVQATNATDASAVALSLLDASEGLEIVNSGKLEASVKGTATKAVATALRIGPAEAPVEEDEVDDQEGLALGVITITNTGTITATNEAGGAYGIYAEFAPDPLVINQQGGSISAQTAIEIDNDNADTLNWSGGSIKGLVSADGKDVVNVLQALKDGKGVATTVTAGTDFALDGAGQLNIGGGKGSPVTFDFAGTTTNVGATTVATDAVLIVEPTGEMQGNTFTMQPDSKVTFVFTPTDAGLITMTGDASIDGTLGAVALPGLYGDKGSHVVIESDTKVVGTFDNVAITGDTLLIDFTATVHPQDVTISWKRTAFNDVAGLTINSTSVATALEDGYDPTRPASKNDPELNDILAGLFTLTDAEKYDRVLNSWSGSEHAQVMRAAANLSEPYLMTIGEHLNDIRRAGAPEQVVMLRPKGSSASIAPLSAAGASGEEQRFAFWGRAFGRFADTNGDIEADGYDEDTFGAVLGFDFLATPNVTVGIAGGYTDDDIDFDDGDAGKIKRWTIGGYLTAQFDGFYFDGSLSYASDDYKVNRTIVYGDTSCLAFNCTTGAASQYDGDGFLGHAEIGYIFAVGEGVGLQPFAGINYSSIDSDPFAETGGGDLGLEVLDGTGKSLQSRLGARLTGEWGSGETHWFPELRVEWRHEFEDDPAWIVASMNGLPDEPFTAIGSKVTSDLAVVGAGVTAVMSNGVGLFLDYQGAFGSGYSSHVIQGGVRVKF